MAEVFWFKDGGPSDHHMSRGRAVRWIASWQLEPHELRRLLRMPEEP